ncbi:MAG: ATP-binding protein [Candidatus Promineifilaceae bacterium]
MTPNPTNDLLNNKLRAIIEVAEVLTAQLDLPQLLQSVIEKITDLLEPAEFGVILLWDPQAQVFQPQAVWGPALADRAAVLAMRLEPGESVTGRVFAENRARLLETETAVAAEKSSLRPANLLALTHAYGRDILPRSLIAAPITAGQEKYGVLVLETLRGLLTFAPGDVPFVQALADLIGLEIDRMRLDAAAAASREAHEANRLRTEILATLSHEMRTPLAAIKGYATALLLEEVTWSPDKSREFLQLIEAECDNLEGMITQVLDSSLIDVGQLEIEPQPVRLPRIAQEIMEEMQRQSRKHRFVINFPAQFPIVDADPQRMKQVIRNILDNAIKYSPDGGLVVISGKVRAEDVVVSVADQGVGISPEDLIPLFDKYFRVKAPTGYHVPGTGLGLPVSRAIVEAHGGRIWADSTVGEGTTLNFSIPLREWGGT